MRHPPYRDGSQVVSLITYLNIVDVDTIGGKANNVINLLFRSCAERGENLGLSFTYKRRMVKDASEALSRLGHPLSRKDRVDDDQDKVTVGNFFEMNRTYYQVIYVYYDSQIVVAKAHDDTDENNSNIISSQGAVAFNLADVLVKIEV